MNARGALLHVDQTAVSDRDRLRVGQFAVEVRSKPGHTPHHLCFIVSDYSSSPQSSLAVRCSTEPSDEATGVNGLSPDPLWRRLAEYIDTESSSVERSRPAHGPAAGIVNFRCPR